MTWEKSPLAPLTQNSVALARAHMQSLADRDAKIGPFYRQRWAELTTAELDEMRLFLKIVSKWSWGHSDADW